MKTSVDYLNRGLAKHKLEDYKGAIEEFNKAIDLNSKETLAFSHRGIDRSKLGDNIGALLDWRKAVELGHTASSDLIKLYLNK